MASHIQQLSSVGLSLPGHSLGSRTQFMTAKGFLFEIQPKWAHSRNVAASENVTQLSTFYWFFLQTHLLNRGGRLSRACLRTISSAHNTPGGAEQRPFVVFAGKARGNFSQGPASSPPYVRVSVAHASEVMQKVGMGEG